jgi:phosphoenolpyruvate carboxykinase (GTP)
MLQLKKGFNILFELGGVRTHAQVHELLAQRLDAENLSKLQRIEHDVALLKIANAIAITDPDDVYVYTGSPEDKARIRELSLKNGDEKALAIDGHTVHYDLPEEQARIVDRTYYIVNEGSDVSIMAKKILREEALEYIREHMTGIARGKTLFVGFYSRGPIGAHAALPAIELSTSAYVMHSANILYRNVYEQFDDEVILAGYVLHGSELAGYLFHELYLRG